MPSYVTHHIFAMTVQRVTGDSAMRTASLYPVSYRWGAQGPDPLAYYHAPVPNAVARLAQQMHKESTAVLFEALCAAAVAQHDTAALAYVFGFCTHYALDRVCSAFLDAQADKLALYKPTLSFAARRRLVESDLDGIMISEYISGDPVRFEAYRLLDAHAAECTVLSRVLSSAAQAVYHAHLRPATVYRALHDTRRIFHIAHSSSNAQNHIQRLEHKFRRDGWISTLIRVSTPHPADCANIAHRPWDFGDSKRTESFCDLFDAAVPLAVSLQRAALERYYQGKALDPRFFPTNFNGERQPT